MSERYYWSAGSGRNIALELSFEDAKSCSHSGQCDEDVECLCERADIADQIAQWNRSDLLNELYEYGAWETGELASHDNNIRRMVWIAACDVAEDPEQYAAE